MPTDRLYYHDSYRREFAARVIDRGDDGRRVYLDQTLFYPTSGGQPHDTGTLGGVRVLDVVDEEDRIAHLLEGPLPAESVAGAIDWARRYDHMQQHTAQHLLSAVFEERFGFATVSVHFGPEVSTLDLDTGTLAPETQLAAERMANAIVGEARPVTVGFEDAGSATGLRKPSDRTGPIRIVTIENLDRSACGGTHLRTTAEAGPLLIRKAERVKQRVRLEFVAGGRALERVRRDYGHLSAMAAQLSAGVDEVPLLVDKLRADLKEVDSARRQADEALQAVQLRELYHQAVPDSTGRRTILIQGGEAGPEKIRALGLAVGGLANAVLIATSPAPPTILYATSADSGVDAGQRLKPLLTEVGGRGGGSARLAQGTAPTKDLLPELVNRLLG